MTQPLDVAFFHPIKMAWRQILEKWKKGDGRKTDRYTKGDFSNFAKTTDNSTTAA